MKILKQAFLLLLIMSIIAFDQEQCISPNPVRQYLAATFGEPGYITSSRDSEEEELNQISCSK